ncbi:MAG: efflux RND transporter periplasmic adaptor subunit [Desulfobacteraceae bacterium]|nr:efflux RND transporter periplasmic adaptor subunit [Desulfobacteraceae bacterium]MBC2719398.1 efflux RND transporter periplasmic adaptor subunit [Desulfobacteraceae bacterium]
MQNKNLTNNTKVLSGRKKRILKIVLPLIIIIAGVAAAFYLKNTGPKSKRQPPVKLAPVVLVKPLFPANHIVMLNAMGTVVPAREVELKPRVTGEVIDISPEFIEGGLLKAGTLVLQIDPEDYKLTLIQKEKALADANYFLKLELGRQKVAKREWELLNGDKDAKNREVELALRKPHLEKAKAELNAAKAELKKAYLDLARTKIKAPFNSMVRSRMVNIGSQVTPQERLAKLVGTDSYWIQTSVSVDRLSWIRIPRSQSDPSTRARIIYAQGYEHTGTVIRLMGDLSPEGRMARVLIEVEDPLGLKNSKNDQPPLLIDDYVRVEIKGKKLENVYKIPRKAFRNNAYIWIASENSTLKIIEVHPVWRDADVVIIDNAIKSGDRLIISDLPAPIDGMPIQVE